jgi:hypothetical protein
MVFPLWPTTANARKWKMSVMYYEICKAFVIARLLIAEQAISQLHNE